MSTFISEPGTRLGGRYRLEDQVAAAGGWAAWKAIDEILARAVTVFTFASGFPRIREVITAARAASRLNDARLTQVFDVEDDWDNAYIVMEWPGGESLNDLIATGPLDPDRGAQIVAEAAGALSAAHAAGLAHLCLTPDSLRWSPGSGAKIVGLGIDAALSGATADDPALADTHGLGKLLYAALTGHWPGPDYSGLPAAPVMDGHPCSPRQVRAGVPAALDDITCQALQLRGRGGKAGAPVITTPAQLASALVAAALPTPPPPSPRPSPRPRATAKWPGTGPDPDLDYRPREAAEEAPPTDGDRFRGVGTAGRGRGSPLRLASLAVLALVVVAGVVDAGLHLGGSHNPAANAASNHSRTHIAPTGVTVLTPQSARGFDETSSDAGFAIDSNPATAWQTQWYRGSPYFGGLPKQGSGLILDMGRQVRLSSIVITFGKIVGSDVEIKVSNTATGGQAAADAMPTVARRDDVGGTVTFTTQSTDRGQYILIWFTKLPPMAGTHNKYLAQIYNIIVRGSG